MRKKATGKTEKISDATVPAEGIEAAPATGPSTSSKAASQSRKRPATKSPKAAAELPRLSLAALAMGTTTASTQAEAAIAKPKKKTPASTKTSKAVAAANVTKAAKLSKPEETKATAVAKNLKPSTAVTKKVADVKPLSSTTETKRKYKGIRLSPSLSTPTSVEPVTAVASAEPPAAPVIQATPEIARPAMPETIEPIRVPAPPIAVKPSFLASVWSALRHPPRPLMAVLSVLIIAFAALVALEEISPTEEVASAPVANQVPTTAGPYGEPLPYDQGPYRAVSYRPYGEPGYRTHYDYRQAPYGR